MCLHVYAPAFLLKTAFLRPRAQIEGRGDTEEPRVEHWEGLLSI